jgi:hypothetical protein
MHETDAMTTTSRRVRSDEVADSRSRAMSSFRDESFSMYRSACGMYASGWK